MITTIIGIDCATLEKKTGLACGTYDGSALLAGADFTRGDVYLPQDLYLAKREGWIWVKHKGS